MSILVWDTTAEQDYEDGISRGVLYLPGVPGVAWSGLIGVDEAVVGNERESFYFDGIKYTDSVSGKDFQGTLKAFSSPKQFDACLGLASIRPGAMLTRQPKTRFGLSYRTNIADQGHKIHLIYNALASPMNKRYTTIGKETKPDTRAWRIDTVPEIVPGFRPASHFIIDTTEVSPEALVALEINLYGWSSGDPYLPTPETVAEILGYDYG